MPFWTWGAWTYLFKLVFRSQFIWSQPFSIWHIWLSIQPLEFSCSYWLCRDCLKGHKFLWLREMCCLSFHCQSRHLVCKRSLMAGGLTVWITNQREKRNALTSSLSILPLQLERSLQKPDEVRLTAERKTKRINGCYQQTSSLKVHMHSWN